MLIFFINDYSQSMRIARDTIVIRVAPLLTESNMPANVSVFEEPKTGNLFFNNDYTYTC